jgi:hypothetical protein
MQRLQAAMRDKEGVKRQETSVRPRVEKYLQDYQQLLRETFSVRDLSQSLRIDLSGIELEAFKENYPIDQGS